MPDSRSETSSPGWSGGLSGALDISCVQGLVGTRHSATPERSYYFLVESARMVGVQMDLHLLW